MIGSNPVRCEVRNKDQYGRNVSSCSVLTNKGPVDIGNFMVSNGYAVAYRYVRQYQVIFCRAIMMTLLTVHTMLQQNIPSG